MLDDGRTRDNQQHDGDVVQQQQQHDELFVFVDDVDSTYYDDGDLPSFYRQTNVNGHQISITIIELATSLLIHG